MFWQKTNGIRDSWEKNYGIWDMKNKHFEIGVVKFVNLCNWN